MEVEDDVSLLPTQVISGHNFLGFQLGTRLALVALVWSALILAVIKENAAGFCEEFFRLAIVPAAAGSTAGHASVQC